MVRKKKKDTKKVLIIAAAVVAVLVIAGLGVNRYNSSHKADTSNGDVNYGPPTDAEKQETEEHKKDLEEQSNNPNPTNTRTVVITSLTTSEARGYVTGVVEDGGTCTLTLTKNGVKVTGTSTAMGDVNKTTCGPITVDSSKLSSGEWDATLSYSSSSGSGVSSTQTLKVP